MGSGSIKLFRFAGVNVSLHFSWFLVAIYQMTSRSHGYISPVFAFYEYLALFGIVLMHEFGHALACRQTGGTADRIMLWPLGGVAFVQPPQRPGAQLWSIAAGPLVNVALLPVIELVHFAALRAGWMFSKPDTFHLIHMVRFINFGLLVFNLFPVYPLDGGQILRSLLWFPLGQIRSLQIATAIGLIGGAAIVLFAFYIQSIWIGILAFFLLSQAWNGWKHAQALATEAAEAKRMGAESERPPML
ncbi:MAG: site-2 protease family protein [Chthoniobacterales bacterium]